MIREIILDLVFLPIRLFVFLYDIITFPIYYLLLKPWLERSVAINYLTNPT